ncbi:MAG: DEAD/DEAH box helicase [Candidatus Heimdallarchaeota archaeon]|nr:DEAD/DEAH box helicase [Candidatus Heimdallarchaeota archaeon]
MDDPRALSHIKTVMILPLGQDHTIQLYGFSRGKISQRKPTIRGKIEYFLKHENLWRPRRLFWEEKGKWIAFPPKNTLQELFQKASNIILAMELPEEEKKGIQGFCQDFNISIPIYERNLCPFCLYHEKVTDLHRKRKFMFYEREICDVCAIQELEKELKVKKIDLLNSLPIRKYALSMLRRLGDVHQVLEIFTSGNTNISDLTLVKKVEKVADTKLAPYIKEITSYNLPEEITRYLKIREISTFLPIQVIAIKKGLLKNQNMLIIADTSAGKTLIGELAGLQHLLKKKKFIFTVPLVALANTKYEEFRQIYGKDFKVGLRTGRSRIFNSIKERETFYRDRFSIKEADIVVATYEGLDLLLRANHINFKEIGCIVIDEVQSLTDEERGATLDCLIAKIRVQSRETQVIALSATVGNPSAFARDLNLVLATFNQRPIPLEEHILISRGETEKRRQIYRLVKKERQINSSKGFMGQTIVFTNSRRKTVEISEYLRSSGIIKAHAYHSGLAFNQRKRIEMDFSSGISPVVVSTYALGAGVDFPASQVIFESLMMGNQILESNSFTQMTGRAGRLGKHDRGQVVLLCSGESISSLDNRSEIEIAFELLKANLIPIEPNHSEDSCGSQILSICSMRKSLSPAKAKSIYETMIGTSSFSFMRITNYLIQNGLIQLKNREKQRFLQLTPLGRAGVLSFYSPVKIKSITSQLGKKREFLSIALEASSPKNVYLSKKLHSYLEKTYHMRFSTRLINSPVLDVMSASLKGKEPTELSKWCLTIFAKWTQNFFNCECKENPFCEHGSEQIGRYLIRERLKGKDIDQISRKIGQFEFLIYPGDILSFLNTLIHELEGIQRICIALNYEQISSEIEKMIKNLEIPSS